MYPAGVAGVSTRFVTVSDGVRVRIVEGGAPDSPCVLLVHGWGGYTYSFAELIPALLHAGYRVLAPELPGHGLSDKPTSEDWYTEESLIRVITTVARHERLRDVVYVGHSMGGLLGLRLAISGGLPPMRGLVLISAAGIARTGVIAPIRALSPAAVNRIVPRLLSRGVIALVLNAAFGTKERPTDHDIDQYWAQTQWDEYAWACRACLHRVDFSPAPIAALRHVKLPVLVVTGGRDRVVGGASVSKRSRLIPGARQVHYRDAGHLVMQELAPKVNAEILSFLSGLRESAEGGGQADKAMPNVHLGGNSLE